MMPMPVLMIACQVDVVGSFPHTISHDVFVCGYYHPRHPTAVDAVDAVVAVVAVDGSGW